MKKIYIAFLLLAFASTSSAQNYTPADAGSKVKFVIKNFGINTSGTFEGLTGTISFDPANLTTVNFDVSVEAKTVDTDSEGRDKHLRRPEYFDVEKFPKIVFKSTKVTKTNKAAYFYLFGNITIKGVTKEVKFPFTYTAKDGGYLFEGEFPLNRRDFGVGGKSFSMSDDLTVVLSVFGKKS